MTTRYSQLATSPQGTKSDDPTETGQSLEVDLAHSIADKKHDSGDAVSTPSYSPQILRRFHETDFLIIFAAVCAIVIGSFGLADAAAVKKNRGPDGSYVLEYLHGPSADFPLIMFGLATTVAWIAACRAVFRATSREANRYLFRGVCQRDLCSMLENGLPTKLRLTWRINLWKSSLFAIFQLALYVGAALSYRRAFKSGVQTGSLDLSTTPTRFLLGCSTDYFSTFTQLLGVDLHSGIETASWSTYAMTALTTLESDDWQALIGWHANDLSEVLGSNLLTSYPAISTQNMTGPFLMGVLQRSNETSPSRNGNPSLVTAEHSTCGTLPHLCSAEYRGTRKCYWIGLAIHIATVSFHVDETVSDADVNTSKPTHDSTLCPLRLNASIYDAWISRAKDAFRMELSLLPWELPIWKYGVMFRNLYASLITEVSIANSDQIPDLAWLRADGLYLKEYQDNVTTHAICNFPKNQLQMQKEKSVWGLPSYTGQLSFPYSTNEWLDYQVGASNMITLWGLSLAVMAWPYKNLIIRGVLDQYMSFGADVGVLHMSGASTGIWTARTHQPWAMRQRFTEDGCRRFCLEPVDADGTTLNDNDSDGPEHDLEFGAKYA